MARRNLVDTINSDNALVDFLVEHKGKANVVSSKEIAEHLTACGFPINASWQEQRLKGLWLNATCRFAT